MSGSASASGRPTATTPVPPAQAGPAGVDDPKIAESAVGAERIEDTTEEAALWRDPAAPVCDRVADLLKRMTLEEKVAQLGAAWIGSSATADDMAPQQHELIDDSVDWIQQIQLGLGQITRPFGTAPIAPADGARRLARMQADVVARSRFGIPAIAHEECLTGFMTWGATVYPTPLAWGATFNPDLVAAMARHIGESMRAVGVHQGLAPVLDVTRDPRWGRTEETIGEDPHLVATLGLAYVRGLEAAGIIATLKHFAAYSTSRAGRNFAPATAGRRELLDVILPPFELAVRDGHVRSVMPSYADVDGIPPHGDPELLHRLLRCEWGFEGTVVADYFGITFLETMQHVAANKSEAAGHALAAGVDVELPSTRCYGDSLLAAVRDGSVPESLVDRAVTRVLRQKFELGLLDPGWSPIPPALASESDGDQSSSDESSSDQSSSDQSGRDQTSSDRIDLDPPAARMLARRIAEESVVLLANDGVLPLARDTRVALVGPQADTPAAMLGAYTFPSHVGTQFPDYPPGVEIPTLLQAMRAELAHVEHAPGVGVDTDDTSGIAAAIETARRAQVCVVALGDRSGLFGSGTSGEGSDAADLRLPGKQAELLEALLQALDGTGIPVVAVLLSGRPYALGEQAGRLAAVVQAFFPGEEGGPAVARVLAGRVNPSGRMPVSLPRHAGGQPATYYAPQLGHRTQESSVDPTPLFPFGHGLSYTSFTWSDVRVNGAAAGAPGDPPVEVDTSGRVSVSVRVSNDGARPGAEVVQLYLHDPVASVTRPVMRLIGYAKVELDPEASARVTFEVPADLAGFTGRDWRRIVEPGDLELRLASSSVEIREVVRLRLVGSERTLNHTRAMVGGVTISPE